MMGWDEFFMGLADYVSRKSKDPSTKVGACITEGKRLVSVGFNGFPQHVVDGDAQLTDRNVKLRRTVHAEKNAILFAARDLTGCTLYSTHMPCSQCAAFIIQAGIIRVVTREPDPVFAARWAEDFAETKAMFMEAGVEVVHHIDEVLHEVLH